jgi:TolB-like protein/Tfp pilus assembly protein PilF
MEHLRSDRETVTLDPTSIEIDAVMFDSLAAARKVEAIGLYSGPLLQDVGAVTPEFGEWLRQERQRLEDRAAELLIELSTGEDDAPPSGAIALCRQLLERDGLREPLHRSLMRFLVRTEGRDAALKAYATCRDTLRVELGVNPELTTEQLYRDILTGRPPEVAQVAPERPTLAVLPFTNPVNDPELLALCDGLAEDITTGLGRFRLLFVIDRYSAAEVARQTMDASEIGKRLGVQYVVQGSLTKLKGQLRIATALVDTASRMQLWGEVFDIPEAEIPATSERIVRPLINTLHGRLEHSLAEGARRKPVLAAYECVLRGIKHLRGYGHEDNTRAIELFQQAIELDPDYMLARAYRAFADVVHYNYEYAPRTILEQSKSAIEQATIADPDEARCHWLLGLTCGVLGENEARIRHHRRAMELNPNDANIKASFGAALAATSRYEEGIATFAEAMRHNPYHPQWYWDELGSILFAAGRYKDAIEALQHNAQLSPWHLSRLIASYALAGRVEKARAMAEQLLHANPSTSISDLREGGMDENDKSQFSKGLRIAGLPE